MPKDSNGTTTRKPLINGIHRQTPQRRLAAARHLTLQHEKGKPSLSGFLDAAAAVCAAAAAVCIAAGAVCAAASVSAAVAV